uniref:wax ester/triacylglycerol synthase domain-containing protein n=1 Tax=Geminicoccus flavidas TaxID=2506407 RepID=UPI001357273C
MTRLLGPEEAKYWLLGHTCPFNIVLAFGVEGWRAPDRLALPVILPDADGLPRWGVPSAEGRIERSTGTWVETAETLLRAPVGMAGAPAWHLSVVEEKGETVVLLALHHALTDARGGLALVGHLLDGRPLPPLPPSFEELLADEAWPDSSVQDEVLGWWSRRMTDRLRSLDLAKLATLLPRPEPARLAVDRLPPDEFDRLRARCQAEGATLHGALVAALPAVPR